MPHDFFLTLLFRGVKVRVAPSARRMVIYTCFLLKLMACNVFKSFFSISKSWLKIGSLGGRSKAMHVFFQILHLQRPSTKLTIFIHCRFALITHRLRKFTLELFRQDFRFYPFHFRRGNLGWRARRKRGKLRNIEYCAFSVFSSLFLHYYFHYPNVRSSRGSKTRKDVSLFSVCGLLPANFFHSNI